jgi:hypothetical protein
MLQPYNAPIPCDDSLAILHDLSNIDKHKLLLVAASYTFVPDTISLSGDQIEDHEVEFIPKQWAKRRIRAADGGAELFRIRFARPVKMSMYAQFNPKIAFDKFGIREAEPLIPSLTHLRDTVTKTIHRFDGEFESESRP